VEVRKDPALLAVTALHSMSATRPALVQLLPNLQKLLISGTASHSIYYFMFFTPSITNLQFKFSDETPQFTEYMLKEIRYRLPALLDLTLHFKRAVSEVQNGVIECFDGLEDLRHVCLPRLHLTTQVLAALSKRPALEKISTIYTEPMVGPVSASLLGFQSETFDNLDSFAIASPLETIAAMLADKEWAPRLKELEVTVPALVDTGSLHQFLDLMVRSRPNLSLLRLDLFNPASATAALSIEIIRPILELSNINVLDIRHNLPPTIESDELANILSSLPNLLHFTLCHDVVHGSPQPGLPWTTLELFALYTPLIQSIGLYFQPCESFNAAEHPFRLESIKLLDVGSSTLNNETQLAIYLAELCSSSMQIRWGDSTKTPLSNAGRANPSAIKWSAASMLFSTVARMRDRTQVYAMGKFTRQMGWRRLEQGLAQKIDDDET